jgi:transcriptional regulator GlxA family with amidase domain
MKTVALLIFPGFEILDLAVMAVFGLANKELGYESYRQILLSEAGGPVPSYSGATVDSRKFRNVAFDTLLVLGSIEAPTSTPRMRSFLQRASQACRLAGEWAASAPARSSLRKPGSSTAVVQRLTGPRLRSFSCDTQT